jgi:serine/threonine protein kinase
MDDPGIQHFGRYEIVAELGRGAMGVVYQARDPQIDRMVAVKTISLWGQEPEEEKEFRLRFLNEAQAAGRLHHPGIVSVFDVGEDPENHDPYIVLEYVPGETLNRVLARERKLPLAKALKLAEELADALAYAHAQGVVHRDIKPANILITAEGHAKIADFGIAKLNLAHFTLPGRVLGTPAYMAPEQLSGEGCDGRSDLFSLGVILYVMTTGMSPFQGDSATTVCFKVANREPVAASALDLNLPPQLDAVISRAIAKDPQQRYQSGSEFSDDLRQLQQNYKPGSTTTSLQAVLPSTAKSTPAAGQPPVPPLTAIAHAQGLFHHMLFKAPIRDLALAALTVILMVVIGAQSKLLVNSSRMPSNGSGALPSAPTANLAPTTAAITTVPAHAPAVPTIPVALNDIPTKIYPRTFRPAHEVVIPSSTLELAVQHQFKDATLYVWVDDKLALTRPLHGGAQKKLIVFNGVRGVESETLSIPAGSHTLRFRAKSADQTTDLSRTISADFIGGADKILQVTFDKHNTMMRLTWE